jgi:hypothetical protein
MIGSDEVELLLLLASLVASTVVEAEACEASKVVDREALSPLPPNYNTKHE